MTNQPKVNFKLLKELRAQTLAGYDLCREALLATDNNFDQAVEWLRVKGIAKGEKKSSTRSAQEGIVKVIVHDDLALILELNCETDFVVKTEKFQDLFQLISEKLLNDQTWTTIDEALNLAFNQGTLKEHILHVSGQLGEKILLSQAKIVKKTATQGFGVYNHNDSHHSALLMFNQKPDQELGETLAMQVVALKPQFIAPDQIPADFLAKEKEILKQSLMNEKFSSKSEKLQDIILTNKLKKRFTEICLTEQIYIKDNQTKISDLIKKFDLKILSMINLKIGV